MPNVTNTMRHTTILVATIVLVVACVFAEEHLDDHIVHEIQEVRSEALSRQLAADDAAESAKSPQERAAEDARSRAHCIKRLGHVPKNFGFDCLTSPDFTRWDSIEQSGEAKWRQDHRVEVVLRDSLHWPTVVALAPVGLASRVLAPVARYLNLPLKIAVGLGFGIALGAWLIKRFNLATSWR